MVQFESHYLLSGVLEFNMEKKNQFTFQTQIRYIGSTVQKFPLESLSHSHIS